MTTLYLQYSMPSAESVMYLTAIIHTIGNKIVGLLVYSIPFLYICTGSFTFLWFLLPLLIIVPLEETCLILRMKKLDLDRKGLFFPEHFLVRK